MFLPVLLPVSRIQETYLLVWEDRAAFVVLTIGILITHSNPLFLPCLPVASSDNGTSISAVSSATPTAGSSDVSFGRKTDAAGPAVSVSDSSDDMDIDVAKVLTVIEAAQACKAHQNMGHD
ncbi:hypothetical protein RO3G_08969 [Rhizopus delemar RA 99-880]|uniref:Uncharacterized protein n=1 Tax=Rhizopus delemar (strain RA 99-880 / ATCC MYA-4621 / FGSC 9543 / NRRL 43880) TaxID=246409 RepID=I1C729_RHIO9|nr:hypothetical protein RO3G_08969 [Rhizopus delemar RA 99-880]|eukprot:EIE84259.1 hypothetical protein RO3G_08969 [Rhizopus delemar RA 99-880]